MKHVTLDRIDLLEFVKQSKGIDIPVDVAINIQSGGTATTLTDEIVLHYDDGKAT